MTPLILASQSPFRRMLMENAGLAFRAQAAEIDERAAEAALAERNPTPQEVAVALAIEKARDVAERNPGALVIGSDQTLSLDGKDALFAGQGIGVIARHHAEAGVERLARGQGGGGHLRGRLTGSG